MQFLPKTNPRNRRKPSFQKWEFVEEQSGLLLAIQFFIAIGLAVYFLKTTLIPLLEASRWFITFGLIGFFITYFLRDRISPSLSDALLYSVFVIAPWSISILLTINSLDRQLYTETYRVKHADQYLNRFEFELENDIYKEFWRIRSMQIESRPARSIYITYTFCDGLLGYKVVKEMNLN